MASRRPVLLTPSISLRLIQALSCTQITRGTPLIPVFVFKRLHTLSFSVSCKSCVCHSYENCRVCTNNSHSGTLNYLDRGAIRFFRSAQSVRSASLLFVSSLGTCHQTQVLYFHTLPNSFALVKNSTLLFSCNSELFAKNTRVWGTPLALFTWKNGEASDAGVEGHTSNRDHRHTARESLDSAILSTPEEPPCWSPSKVSY